MNPYWTAAKQRERGQGHRRRAARDAAYKMANRARWLARAGIDARAGAVGGAGNGGGERGEVAR